MKFLQDFVNNNSIRPIGLQAITPSSPKHRAQKQPFGSSFAVNNDSNNNNAVSAATVTTDLTNDKGISQMNEKISTNYTTKGKTNILLINIFQLIIVVILYKHIYYDL